MDKKIETLHKVVDFLIRSNEDVCRICEYYNREAQAKSILENEDEEPCKLRRRQGELACRNGIIEYFQKEEQK